LSGRKSTSRGTEKKSEVERRTTVGFARLGAESSGGRFGRERRWVPRHQEVVMLTGFPKGGGKVAVTTPDRADR